MHPHNMPTIVVQLSSQVRTERALVHDSSRHMGTDMRIEITSIASFERAVGTVGYILGASFAQMSCQMEPVFVALATLLTVKTARNS